MNILMMTNTYTPIVGGIERSIEEFSAEYRARGHRVLIVAPVFKHMPPRETGVFRIPAIQNFNGTDFSVELPIPGILKGALDDFNPDIVHSHHPFLVGDTALRVSAGYDIPIVLTYHTMYELNTHYVPGDSDALRRFVIQLATGYANLCDRVIAPSRGVADILRERGVEPEITVIPTGIRVDMYSAGDGFAFRRRYGIPEKAFVAGYLGRIAEEKNLLFLAEAVVPFLRRHADAHFLLVGDGDSAGELKAFFTHSGVGERVHCTGMIEGETIRDAYRAMDVFLFASQSETQGIVLIEAMAAGVPVIAIDARGTREVVRDGENGYLIGAVDRRAFGEGLERFYEAGTAARASLADGARRTAGHFDYRTSVGKVLSVYGEAVERTHARKDTNRSAWAAARRSVRAELEILSNVVKSAGAAIAPQRNGHEKNRA